MPVRDIPVVGAKKKVVKRKVGAAMGGMFVGGMGAGIQQPLKKERREGVNFRDDSEEEAFEDGDGGIGDGDFINNGGRGGMVQGGMQGNLQGGMVQNGMVQNGMVQNGMVQNGMVQNGMVQGGGRVLGSVNGNGSDVMVGQLGDGMYGTPTYNSAGMLPTNGGNNAYGGGAALNSYNSAGLLPNSGGYNAFAPQGR